MKKFIAVLIATLALGAVGFASSAPAAYEEGEPYLERYKELHAKVNPDAQCGTGGGSGAFGYYGPGYDLGHPNPSTGGEDQGANGYKTGENNSAVCGNRP
jgi:hypothetical protein